MENDDLFEYAAEPDSGAESVSPSTSGALDRQSHQRRQRRFVPRAAVAPPSAPPTAASPSASSSSRRSSLDDPNDLDGVCGAGAAGDAPVCRPRLYLWLKQLRLHKYEQLFAELSFPGAPPFDNLNRPIDYTKN